MGAEDLAERRLIAVADPIRDLVQPQVGRFEQVLRPLHPQALHVLQRRDADLRGEVSEEAPRAHVELLRHAGEIEGLVEVLGQPTAHRVRERRRPAGSKERPIDEGRLALASLGGEGHARGKPRHLGTRMAQQERMGQVGCGGERCCRRHAAVLDDHGGRVDRCLGEHRCEAVGEEPRGGRPPAIEEPGAAQQKGADADRGDNPGAPTVVANHRHLWLEGSQPIGQALDRKEIEARHDEEVDAMAQGVDPDRMVGGGDELAPERPCDLDVERRRAVGTEAARGVVRDVQQISERERLGCEATVVEEDADGEGG